MFVLVISWMLYTYLHGCKSVGVLGVGVAILLYYITVNSGSLISMTSDQT